MNWKPTTLVTIALLLVLAACKEQQAVNDATSSNLDEAFSKDTIEIVNDDGVSVALDVYLAINYEQKRRGLMYVRSLPENTGMLFVYEDTSYHSMWMKNTYISLDMLFARADGSISSVIHDTTPQSLDSQSSIEPVNYVLELNAGSARRLGIGNNSRIVWDGLLVNNKP